MASYKTESVEWSKINEAKERSVVEHSHLYETIQNRVRWASPYILSYLI